MTAGLIALAVIVLATLAGLFVAAVVIGIVEGVEGFRRGWRDGRGGKR